jgi:hypothetical protein
MIDVCRSVSPCAARFPSGACLPACLPVLLFVCLPACLVIHLFVVHARV